VSATSLASVVPGRARYPHHRADGVVGLIFTVQIVTCQRCYVRRVTSRPPVSRIESIKRRLSSLFTPREPVLPCARVGTVRRPLCCRRLILLSEELLECTECSAQCEKVVYPAACLSVNCRFLYAFKEDGDTFFGCIEKVFPHEIDLKMFEDIERGKGGFGVVKVARAPLPQCSVAVQSCYASGEGPLCRNMYFRRRDRREVQTVED
jgi:hypothetical protein